MNDSASSAIEFKSRIRVFVFSSVFWARLGFATTRSSSEDYLSHGRMVAFDANSPVILLHIASKSSVPPRSPSFRRFGGIVEQGGWWRKTRCDTKRTINPSLTKMTVSHAWISIMETAKINAINNKKKFRCRSTLRGQCP